MVGATTNLQQLAKVILTRIAISAELRGVRRSIECAKASRLLLQSCFKLLQCLCRLIHLQQHLAQQLARWGQRPGRHRAFLCPIFQFRCRLHLPQRFLFFALRERSPSPDCKLPGFPPAAPSSFRWLSRGALGSAAALPLTRSPPRLSQPCRAQSAREPRHCIRIRKWCFSRRELRSLLPVLTFQRVSCRDCRQRKISNRGTAGAADHRFRIEA